jgi:Na+/H+-dicarboxylate symporter
VAHQSFWDVLRRMVPENLFDALGDNSRMLQVIFFALLFGYFILRTAEPHRSRMSEFFQSAFEVIMQLAGFVLRLIPYGVFALLVRVVGKTGFGLFESLGLYMAMVAGGLVFHSVITLPVLLKFVGRVSPIGWAKAMGPALLTAFSTSSSSMTLPVSLESVEHRGKVSNRTTSFVLPLGATINMDGTAIYQGVCVLFIGFAVGSPLNFNQQLTVILTAVLASIGTAGVPGSGAIMLMMVLNSVGLAVEPGTTVAMAYSMIFGIDALLDMGRTALNVTGDLSVTCAVAKAEGEIDEACWREPALDRKATVQAL